MARLNLGWLKPPKVPEDGVMALGDHLREFRYRMVVASSEVLVATIACAFFYQQILAFMLEPIVKSKAILSGTHPELNVQATLQGVVSPAMFVFSVVLMAGVVASSPLWLYQVWAYIRPALLRNEKRYAVAFIAAAVPLFLAGCALGYWVLPNGVVLMMSFTPQQVPVMNQIPIDDFMSLMIRLMVIFGLGFLMPLIVVALNLVGVVSGAALKRARKGVVFGCFVFAGALTPGGDPLSMLALAVPMMLLFLIAEGLCHVNDRRRAKKLADAEAAEQAERAARMITG